MRVRCPAESTEISEKKRSYGRFITEEKADRKSEECIDLGHAREIVPRRAGEGVGHASSSPQAPGSQGRRRREATVQGPGRAMGDAVAASADA
jgi:hypothetical protein